LINAEEIRYIEFWQDQTAVRDLRGNNIPIGKPPQGGSNVKPPPNQDKEKK